MLSAVKFYKEIRAGSSLPLIVGGSDGRQYVVKLRGSGEGALASAVEWLALKLGKLLQIPVLEPALLAIEAGFDEQAGDPETREILQKSIGLNFAARYLEDASAYTAQSGYQMDDALKSDIFLFDLFLLNIDRNAKNPNMIVNQSGLWALDYSSSLAIRGAIDGKNYEKLPFLREIKRHPFYGEPAKPHSFIAKLKAIDDRRIFEIVEELPGEWIGLLPVAKETGEAKKIIRNRLIDQKNYSHILLKRLDVLKVLKIETEEERSLRMLKNRQVFERKFGKL